MKRLPNPHIAPQVPLFPNTVSCNQTRPVHDLEDLYNSPVGQSARFRRMIELLQGDDNFPPDSLRHTAMVLHQLEPAIREGLHPALSDEILKQHQLRPEGEDAMYRAFGVDARVPVCRECGGKCCKVHPETSDGNLIVMPACEWVASQNSGIDINHLEIVRVTNADMFHVSCSNGLNGCSGCGPNKETGKLPGIKPADCVFYPWFPNLREDGRLEMWIADNRITLDDHAPKCTATSDAKLAHLPAVIARFSAMLSAKPSFRRTYTNAIDGMIGYRKFNPSSLNRLSPQAIQRILGVGMNLTLEEARDRLANSGAPAEEIDTIMAQYTRDLSRKVIVASRLVGSFYYSSNPTISSISWAEAAGIPA